MRKRKLFIIILILVLLLAFGSFIIIHAANNDDVFNTIKNNIESYYNNLNNNHKLKVSINNNDIANTKNLISQYQETIDEFEDTDSIHDIYTTLQSRITDGSAKPNIITGYINIKRTMDNLFEVSTQESDITVKDNNGTIYKYTPLDKDLEGNYSALNNDIAVYKPQTQFLSIARKVKEHVENLVLLYSVTNDQKYFDAIKLEMFNAIEWKNYWQSTQFIDTSEIAYAVSLGYDFTYNDLTSEEKCKIENKLLYSIMLFNTKTYASNVNSSKGNFNQVAHSGMGIVSLTLIDSSNEGQIKVTSIDTNKKTISIEYPVKSIKNGSLSIQYNNGLIIRKNDNGEYVTYDAQITDSEMYDLIVNHNLIKEDSNGNKYITLRHFYTAVIAKTVEFLPKVLKSDNTYIDGSYPEGKEYYLYGMRYFSYYLATLQNTLKKDYDLLNFETYNDKNRVVFDNIVLNPVYISNAKGINLAYGDARNDAHAFEGDLFYLADLNAKKTNRNTIANVIYDYRKKTYGTWNFYSILWYNETYDIEKIDNIEYDRIFNVKIYQNDIVKKNINRLGVSAFRKSFTDSNSIFVAMRGGDTKDNHTHLDLGSYIFEALGTRWINDDGSGPYDGKKYQDKEYLRWQYYSARAESHSTIVINTPETIDTDNKGTCLHADQWVNAYAEFELFESSENSNIAKINLTDAYNKNNNDDIKNENLLSNTNTNEVHRGIKLFNNKRYMLVQDEVSLKNVKEYYSFLNIDKTKNKAKTDYLIKVAISENGKEATLTDDKGNTVKLYLKSNNDKVKFKMIDEITNGTGLLNNFIGNPGNNTNVNLEKNNEEKYMNHNRLVVYLSNDNASSVNMKVGVFFVPQYNDGTDISQSMLRLNSLSNWYIPQKPEIKIYSGDTEINNQGSAYNSAIIKINTQDEIQSNEILKYSLDNGTNWYLYDDNNEEDVQRRTISQIGNNTINVLAILDDGFGVESDTARLSDFSFEIIENKKLNDIVISSPPTKTSYIEGENFDASGMEVTATYDNGSTQEVTNYTITDGNNLTSDKTSVTISYTEDGVTKTTTQEITVSKKILSSIEVTTPPSKTTYIEGQNFDPAGMKVTATYNNGSTKEVTNYTITDGNNLTSDKTSITISYTEDGVTKTTTQEITVSKITLSSIEVTTPPSKITYIEGQNFDPAGMKIAATYNDGSTKEVTNYTITDGNNLTSDKTSITISYAEAGVTKTTTQEITVSKKILSSIEVSTPPSKTTYIEGQNFDSAGMKVIATYDNGTTNIITNYEITDGNNLTSDKTSITISYTEDGVTKITTQEITVSKKVLSSIEVTAPPTKTSYIEGENFDTSGMEVTATYDNGSTKEVTNYTITDGNNLTSDKTSVTISYTEDGVTKATTQEITVKNPLSSIEVTTPPSKTTYIEGQNFDPSGMKIAATYNNGSTKEVTNYTITDGNNLTSDKTSVTISYTEDGVTKTTTQEITVSKKILSSIEVSTPPSKTTYIEGQNFDPSGMKIAATYNDGSTKEVTNYTITDGNNLTSDKSSITISYTEDGVTKTTTQEITVSKKILSSIEVTAPPTKTSYIEGENFDTSGMEVTATYDNGSTKEVTNYTITDGNDLTSDKTSITISYTEDGVTKTTTQEITVKNPLSSIEVTTPPSKTTYIEGQNFDPSGMKIAATYNNGSTKEVTNYTITDGNNLTSDKTSVTISYTEDGVTKTTTQEITVSKKILNSIEVATPPSKTTYIEGQNFDSVGMKIAATYNDGSTKEVTNYTITDGNNLTSDKTSITISYTEDGVTKTTTQEITVSKKVLSSIKVTTPPSKTTYIEGQNFDPSGMKIAATYNNGSTKEVTNYTITDGNNLTSDKTSITISYTENGVTKTTTQKITVKNPLSSIEVTTSPSKTKYIEGQNFDPSGMKIAATYNNGSTKEVTNYTITDGNSLTSDKTSVTISYTEDGVTKTTTQEITVRKKILSSIEVTTPPTKTSYIEGENFDASGMEITATYDNGTTNTITNYEITDGNNLTSDKTSITISYTENGVTKTTTQKITVKNPLSSIEVTTPPSKTTYIEGQNFDSAGMKIAATYNNGSTKEVTNYTITDGNNLTSDKTSVTISYTEDGVTKTTTQEITVSKKILSSIEVLTPPSKTKYIEEQNFDSAGMKVTATYNNGSTKEVTNYTITDGNNLTLDKTSITISYTEDGVTKTTIQEITVSKKILSSIEVTTPPSKTTYIEGQNFDPSGMKIAATYNNGSTKEVTNYTITDGNNLTSDKTSVTISYTEDGVTKTTTQEITVSKKILSSIEVTTPPSKTTYIEGQNFDPSGMKIATTYNDGSTKEVTNYTITDGNNLTSDKTSVTISYTEDGVTKTTTQEITVSKKILSSIEVSTPPSKTTYIEGQNFDPAGMKVTATYDNGTTNIITNYEITDGNNLTSDKTSITISYTEDDVTKTTTQEITVIKKLKISFVEYNEVNKDGVKYIDNIAPSTTIEEMIDHIETNGTIKVYKGNEEITDKKIKTSTGMKVKISLNNENYEYTTVVKGDTNGDGESNLRDLLQINKHRLNKSLLRAEYLLAGDVNKDNEVNLKDLLQLNKYRLGKINTL